VEPPGGKAELKARAADTAEVGWYDNHFAGYAPATVEQRRLRLA